MNISLILAETVDEARMRMLMWGGLLLVVVIVGFGAILFFRRYLQDPTVKEEHVPGFSLSELRAMRDREEITAEEYEQTRARVIAKVKAKLEEPPKVKPPRLEDEKTDFGS